MNEDLYVEIDIAAKALKVDFTGQELAQMAVDHRLSPEQLEAVSMVFGYLKQKKHDAVISTLLKMSRLPVKEPKTFDNYDFSRIHGHDADAVKNLTALAEVNARRNIAFIGPTGVGKTHLAKAYGRACCEQGMKTYFLKASELNEKFTNARKYGREDSCKNGLVKPTCLIIDEIGKGHFDVTNTEMFFDLIDRQYSKEGPQTTIMTSNLQPSQWKKYFEGTDDLLCALDRMFDEAEIFNIKGKSYRGRNCQVFSAEVGPEGADGN